MIRRGALTARSRRRGRLHQSTVPGVAGCQAQALWFSLPAIVLVGVFFVVPLVINIPLAFSNWTSYSSTITLDGWANFQALIDQGYLFSAIRVTLVYSLIAMLVQNVVSLPLAVALQDATRTNNFFRASSSSPC